MPVSRTRPNARPRTRAPQKKKPDPGTLSFLGSDYRLASKIGIWPMMQFARAAESGLSSADQKGMAAIHALLQDVIHPDDWGRFEDDMITKKLDDLEPLLQVVSDAIAVVARRQGERRTAKAEILSDDEELELDEDEVS